MHTEALRAIADFHTVASLAGSPLDQGHLTHEWLPAPHRQKSLPSGMMAVYVFFLGPTCLKVGKAGSNSGPRYTVQHYSPGSSNSNLASSLLSGRDLVPSLPEFVNPAKEIGPWLKQNTSRLNFLLPSTAGIRVLSLLESFLQCRFRPAFEGFKSQR
jgi:hypothetical protein